MMCEFGFIWKFHEGLKQWRLYVMHPDVGPACHELVMVERADGVLLRFEKNIFDEWEAVVVQLVDAT